MNIQIDGVKIMSNVYLIERSFEYEGANVIFATDMLEAAVRKLAKMTVEGGERFAEYAQYSIVEHLLDTSHREYVFTTGGDGGRTFDFSDELVTYDFNLSVDEVYAAYFKCIASEPEVFGYVDFNGESVYCKPNMADVLFYMSRFGVAYDTAVRWHKELLERDRKS